MKPAVLHVATRYLRGGSERRIADATSALDEFDHDVAVGSDSDTELLRHQIRPRRIFTVRRLIREIRPHHDIAAVLELRRIISEGGYDAVFTHQSKGGIVGRLAARLAGGVPVIHSLSSASFGPGYSPMMSWVQRSVERLLDHFTSAYSAVGSDLADRFVANGVAPEKIMVIRSGAVPSKPPGSDMRQRVVSAYGLDPDRPILAVVGSIDDRKNIMNLPEVLSNLDTKYQVLVVGDGQRRDDLEQSTARWDVIFTGHVSDAVDLIAGSDRLLLLSRSEGLPQVLAQAGATGTPFVSFPVDGAAELRSLGASGQVVPLDDYRAMAHSLDQPVNGAARDHLEIRFDVSSWETERIRASYRELARSVGLL